VPGEAFPALAGPESSWSWCCGAFCSFSGPLVGIEKVSTIIFDRYNYTILEVIELVEEWEAISYGPDDFFPIFDANYTVNVEKPG
jgi:hypothetical protein